MQKRSLNLLIAIVMFGSLFTLTSPIQIGADQLDEIREQIKELEKNIKDVQSDRNSINSDISNVDGELHETRQQKQNTLNELEKIDTQLSQTQTDIDQKKNEISQKENEINKVQQEIKELEDEITRLENEIVELIDEIEEKEKKIEQREELLKDRLRTLQRNGGNIAYLEVIFGAQDFGDFITRTTAVNKIMEQDQTILKDFLNDKQELEQSKKQLEDSKVQVVQNKEELNSKRESLENQKQSLLAEKQKLESLQSTLASQMNEKNNVLAQIQEREQEIESYRMSLAEQEETLRSQERAFKRLLEEYKNQEKFLTQTAGGQPSTSGFIRPAQGRVTSEFGARWGTTHYGIDIAKSGTVPVVAAAGGIVSRSYYSSSYGNVVFVSHVINGQTYTTVYAHLRSRSVAEGQFVQQGQLLGYMGNTGHSYGQHLHFEIHVGEWNYAKSNAVNPRKYVNF